MKFYSRNLLLFDELMKIICLQLAVMNVKTSKRSEMFERRISYSEVFLSKRIKKSSNREDGKVCVNGGIFGSENLEQKWK